MKYAAGHPTGDLQAYVDRFTPGVRPEPGTQGPGKIVWQAEEYEVAYDSGGNYFTVTNRLSGEVLCGETGQFVDFSKSIASSTHFYNTGEPFSSYYYAQQAFDEGQYIRGGMSQWAL